MDQREERFDPIRLEYLLSRQDRLRVAQLVRIDWTKQFIQSRAGRPWENRPCCYDSKAGTR